LNEFRPVSGYMVGEHCGVTVNKMRLWIDKAVTIHGLQTARNVAAMPLISLIKLQRPFFVARTPSRLGTATPVKRG
jgi:hypothetical protein